MNNNYKTILNALNADKYTVFFTEIYNWRLDNATKRLARAVEEAKKVDLNDLRKVRDFSREAFKGLRAVLVNSNPKSYYRTDKEEIVSLVAGEYSVNVATIKKHAELEWDDNKCFYASRVSEKITDLLGDDAEIVLNLSLGGCLVGYVDAVKDGKSITLKTDTKTNYRYGDNSANGSITVYYQVPTLVVAHAGFDLAATEESVIKAKADAKTNAKAEKLARSEKLNRLKSDKRKVSDAYENIRAVIEYVDYSEEFKTSYLANAAKLLAPYGITVEKSVECLKVVGALKKKITEEIKAMKK